MCLAQFNFRPSLSKRSGASKGFNVGVSRGPDVKGTPTITSRQCNTHSLPNCFYTMSAFEARHSRGFGCSLVFYFSKGEVKWCRCKSYQHLFQYVVHMLNQRDVSGNKVKIPFLIKEFRKGNRPLSKPSKYICLDIILRSFSLRNVA